MKNRLPLNPLQLTKVSPVLRIVIFLTGLFANIFGVWRYPRKNAATEFSRMSFLDKLYWVYKGKKPVIRPERGLSQNCFKKHPAFNQGGDVKVDKTITLGAVGDLIAESAIGNSKDILYKDVYESIFVKDISIANLECPIWDSEPGAIEISSDKTPSLFCTLSQYEALVTHKHYKYTILNTACNHSLDKGIEGLRFTLDRLGSDGIKSIGTAFDAEEYKKGVIIEKNDIKIGFISATFGINDKIHPMKWKHSVNIVEFHEKGKTIDLSVVDAQRAFCREQGCDFIIANLHWGFEFEFFPRREQLNIARTLVENGVDLILSHHPHVLQPYEMYLSRRTPHKSSLITYSLGSLTDVFSAPALVLSCILNFSINKGKINDRYDTFVDDVRFIPVVQVETTHNNRPAIQLRKLSDILIDGNHSENIPVQKICSYADLIFGKNWRNA